MNAPALLSRPARVKLTVDDFMLLRDAGAFAAFGKTELLDGELSGVPLKHDDGREWESDASVPIKLRIADYELLDEHDAFARTPRTELIDGVVYAMSPQFRPHDYAKSEMAYRLRDALKTIGSSLYVLTDTSVAMPPHGEPRPDVLLTSEPRGDGAVPVASIPLLVEIAVNSLPFDRGVKAGMYAAAGVPEYWIVDVQRRSSHRMWAPGPDGYAERDEVALGKRLESVTVAGLGVGTDGLV